MQFDVKIRKVIENGKPLKALASVTVDGSFTIHNVRVIKTENAQFVAMPYRQPKQHGHIHLFARRLFLYIPSRHILRDVLLR